jgi:hypothetical protein
MDVYGINKGDLGNKGEKRVDIRQKVDDWIILKI